MTQAIGIDLGQRIRASRLANDRVEIIATTTYRRPIVRRVYRK